MKCEDYQAFIEEYIDGELDAKTAARITAHLSACEACAEFAEEVRREQMVYASYRRDVEVTPALWAAVEQRIESERASSPAPPASRIREWFAQLISTPRFSPALAAALVIVTVGITAAVMSYLQPNRPAPDNGDVAKKEDSNTNRQPGNTDETGNANKGKDQKQNEDQPVPGNNESESTVIAGSKSSVPKRRPAVTREPTPEQLIREAEQKYLAAITILSRDVQRKRTEIDPMVLARFDAALSDIDYTIAETRKAARQNPNDPIALQYMLTAYAKKVDVLREMARD